MVNEKFMPMVQSGRDNDSLLLHAARELGIDKMRDIRRKIEESASGVNADNCTEFYRISSSYLTFGDNKLYTTKVTKLDKEIWEPGWFVYGGRFRTPENAFAANIIIAEYLRKMGY